MALRDRLNTLRRDSGVTARDEGVGSAPDTGVAGRLRRLGADHRRSGASPSQQPTPDAATLATELGGFVIADSLIARDTPITDVATDALAERPPQRAARATTTDPTGLLFVDTETSGLAGGAGTVAFMVGLLRSTSTGWVCRQYLLTGFSGEPCLYDCLRAEAASAHTVVSYNGKTFDAPLMRDRACLNRRAEPLAGLSHIDLLTLIRRLFGARWPDCRLVTAEARLLGASRDNDLPGDQAPQAWFDFLHRGNTHCLQGVLRHNQQDLTSLAQLWPLLGRAQIQPQTMGADVGTTARGWLEMGFEAYARELMAGAEGQLGERQRLEYARLARRAGDLKTAVRIWRELAAGGNDQAIEALAKHYEHRQRDPMAALNWARRLHGYDADRRQRRLRAKCQQLAPQRELGL